jgi:hypothetical protein
LKLALNYNQVVPLNRHFNCPANYNRYRFAAFFVHLFFSTKIAHDTTENKFEFVIINLNYLLRLNGVFDD